MRHCTTLLKIQLFCICCILFIQYFCKSIKKAIKSNWQYSCFITHADDHAQSHCSPGLRIHYKKKPIVTICTFHTTASSFPNMSSYKNYWFLCSQASAENTVNSMCFTVAITSCHRAQAAAFSCLAALLGPQLRLIAAEPAQRTSHTWIPSIPAAGRGCRLLSWLPVAIKGYQRIFAWALHLTSLK